MGEYRRPESIDEAVALLRTGRFTPVAGCTDYYCRRDARPDRDDVLDVTGIAEARGIRVAAGEVRIGALTTWTDLATRALPPAFDALAESARQIGGVQIQNAGTLGGNLCNASPAADGMPPLLMLDASVELASAAGTRRLPLAEFIVGSRRTARRRDEILTAIVVPAPPEAAASVFLKLGARAYQVISIVMVAALLVPDGAGRIARAAVAVGACSEVALRLPAVEADLAGRPLAGPPLSASLHPGQVAALRPLDDVRATAVYRSEAALTLVGRALDTLQERLG